MRKIVLASLALSLMGCGSQTADVLTNQTAASGNVQARGTLLDEAPPVQAPRAFDDTFNLPLRVGPVHGRYNDSAVFGSDV